jgi:hypothetical protein
MRKADFTYEIKDNIVRIVDLNLGNVSVTNDAENVLTTIQKETAWQKYQKIISCDHEMERRGRTDGYAYCKHCSYSATVFEPLTKCCKCGKPTSYDTDFRGKYYCKKHAATKPKNPDKSKRRLWDAGKKRLPRKRKKLLKRCATKLFRENGINGKVTYENRVYVTFKCSGKKIDLLFKSSEKSLIAKYK